jgi:hypothetical protein
MVELRTSGVMQHSSVNILVEAAASFSEDKHSRILKNASIYLLKTLYILEDCNNTVKALIMSTFLQIFLMW